MKKIIFILWTLSFLSCGKTHKLTSIGKPLKSKVITSTFGLSTVSFLFVLDTSGSMNKAHQTMVSNFQNFLSIIQDYPFYHYNFAITTMIPSDRFYLPDRPPLFMPSKEHFANCDVDSSSFIQHSALGDYFRYKPYNYKFKDILCLLSQSISVVSIHGSSNEEYYFSALDYILKFPDHGLKKSFFSEDNFLVIFFVSDAVGEVAEKNYYLSSGNRYNFIEYGRNYGLNKIKKIMDYKGDKQIKVYGVIPRAPVRVGETCGEGSASRIVNFPAHVYSFIEETKGKYFFICDDNNRDQWGRNLKIISEDLKRTLTYQKILLEELPLVDTMKVYLNDHELPNDLDKGWYYNPETVSIHISRSLDSHKYRVEEGSEENEYRVEYHPFNQHVLLKGREE